MSSEPSIFFADPNERQGSFLRRTFVFGGLTALLSMLNSCASNVTVVNIDNGFGAAMVASLINRV